MGAKSEDDTRTHPETYRSNLIKVILAKRITAGIVQDETGFFLALTETKKVKNRINHGVSDAGRIGDDRDGGVHDAVFLRRRRRGGV